MSNKLEATFHQGEPLPQRQPFMTLADWDGAWQRHAEQARLAVETPPWVKARRAADSFDPRWDRVMLGIAGIESPPPPPPEPAPEPPKIPPSWYHRPDVVGMLIGTVVWLVFFGMLTLVALIGL